MDSKYLTRHPSKRPRKRSCFHEAHYPPCNHLVLFCIVAICLPTFSQAYNDSWNLEKTCMNRCDNHRKPGWRSEFSFDCDKHFDNSSEEARNRCRMECLKCPDWICKPDKPNIYNCPETDIKNVCKRRCDSNREKGNLDGYVFECDKAYQGDENEVQLCQEDCALCPAWVCDKHVSTNTYYCPTGEYDGECSRNCEQRRRELFGDGHKESFNFSCTDLNSGKDECERECRACPLMICNADVSTDAWTCPSKHEPKIASSAPVKIRGYEITEATKPQEPEYRGKCKDRCDKFRLGGTGKYTLKCTELFNSPAEQHECKSDCHFCPYKICNPHQDTDTFNCPVADSHPPDKGAWKMMSETALLIILGVLSGIMTILCIVVSCAYRSNRRKLREAESNQEDSYEIAVATASVEAQAGAEFEGITPSVSVLTSSLSIPENALPPPPSA